MTIHRVGFTNPRPFLHWNRSRCGLGRLYLRLWSDWYFILGSRHR